MDFLYGLFPVWIFSLFWLVLWNFDMQILIRCLGGDWMTRFMLFLHMIKSGIRHYIFELTIVISDWSLVDIIQYINDKYTYIAHIILGIGVLYIYTYIAHIILGISILYIYLCSTVWTGIWILIKFFVSTLDRYSYEDATHKISIKCMERFRNIAKFSNTYIAHIILGISILYIYLYLLSIFLIKLI